MSDVDAERLVADYLRDDDEVAAIAGRRVVGKSPSDTVPAWVRLVQLDESHDDVSDYSSGHYLQLDCYAGRDGGQPEAAALGRAVRSALVRMPGLSNEHGIVTGVQVNGHGRIPDVDFEEARERVIVTATVWAH